MLNNQPVFAELFGLVIFNLDRLVEFKQRHNLDEDLLTAFTTTDLGTQLSEEGVVIPLTGILGEYYHFSIHNQQTDRPYLTENQIVIKSDGWILESRKGELTVCGIGYLKQFDSDYFAHADKFIRLPILPGWNEVTITGGIDDSERLVYELSVVNKSDKPLFSGNFEDSFNITDQ